METFVVMEDDAAGAADDCGNAVVGNVVVLLLNFSI